MLRSTTLYLLITITVLGVNPMAARAQELTNKAPASAKLPDGPELPVATVIPEPDDSEPLTIDSDRQSKSGDTYVLDGGVVVHFEGRTVEADHIEYNNATGELLATGHLHATGGANHEEIRASHGTMNLKEQTGHFYDVTGSVGVKKSGKQLVYLNSNPFLFTGREVVRTGPHTYDVYDGTVTSCQLPHPDWLLSARHISMDDEKARAKNSIFHLLNVPLLYLPYVTHPVDSESRQSGLLIPVIGQSSTKGLVLGEEIYFALNRSTDLTVAAEYFSLRGWMNQVTFRNRGRGDDFVQSHYSQLFDRGFTPAGGVYTNQGGEDVTFAARHDFSSETRAVADIEYLSSYIYREAFTENFNQAISTDIVSYAYGVHSRNGYTESLEADRYQGLKQTEVAATPTQPASGGQEVRIFHAPSVNFTATDHPLGTTGLIWSLDSSVAGLKRVQPNFVTGGVTERFDLHPEITYPLFARGWSLRPALGLRETLYSRRRDPLQTQDPVELTSELGRSDLEGTAELRAPVAERVFDAPWIERVAHGPVKHTIEPSVTYRYVTGVNNFMNVLRFDDRDVVSNTNEIEYGVTQRVFARRASRDSRCGAASEELDGPIATATNEGTPAPALKCTTREWISWRLAQKTFFDKNFGNAIMLGRRNILSTTLDFSGVAFLTEPRNISPLISRLRVRTSDSLDIEWDFDLDTGAKKFTANNLLLDLHRGNSFAGLSYARLNAPGRSYVEGVSSLTSDFDQMRVLLGYGKPTKRGLSVAANAGLDLNKTQVQYGAIQTSYNWDCCGLSVEYRKYELGAVRNENAYRFNFTLANIGTAGNLRRAERLF